jgi:CheY-like chemotaxis protein
VVEDEPEVRELMAEILRDEECAVETAADGREGLDAFQPDRFDLVVTDQAMPAVSGTEMGAAIKMQAPDKPIILVTGFGELAVRDGVKPAGVDLVVSKPITIAKLRQAIAQVMGK